MHKVNIIGDLLLRTVSDDELYSGLMGLSLPNYICICFFVHSYCELKIGDICLGSYELYSSFADIMYINSPLNNCNGKSIGNPKYISVGLQSTSKTFNITEVVLLYPSFYNTYNHTIVSIIKTGVQMWKNQLTYFI